jgi:predicted 3-demethylubiquinone-9 3-methyltransferase (glyoxalase superfamily)
MSSTQKIKTYLWFDNNAEEAVNFYTSIFKNSKTLEVMRYGDAGPGPKGAVMLVTFQLEGQEFIALNGGPQFKFTEAISFVIECETQKEIDYYWDRLLEGGQAQQCGWLKDRYGVSWQVVPADMMKFFSKKPEKVMQAMLKMVKLDIAALREAGK